MGQGHFRVTKYNRAHYIAWNLLYSTSLVSFVIVWVKKGTTYWVTLLTICKTGIGKVYHYVLFALIWLEFCSPRVVASNLNHIKTSSKIILNTVEWILHNDGQSCVFFYLLVCGKREEICCFISTPKHFPLDLWRNQCHFHLSIVNLEFYFQFWHHFNQMTALCDLVTECSPVGCVAGRWFNSRPSYIEDLKNRTWCFCA